MLLVTILVGATKTGRCIVNTIKWLLIEEILTYFYTVNTLHFTAPITYIVYFEMDLSHFVYLILLIQFMIHHPYLIHIEKILDCAFVHLKCLNIILFMNKGFYSENFKLANPEMF